MNEKRHSNKHQQNKSFEMVERMKRTGTKEHNTTIEPIQCQVQLNTKYYDDG